MDSGWGICCMKFDQYRQSGSQFVSHTTNLMISGILAFWFLAIINYGEPFRFFYHAFSSLGSLETPGGFPNQRSVIYFVISMLIVSNLMWSLARFYRQNKPVNGNYYAFLYYLGSVGAIITCMPVSISKPIHSVGSGLLVFSHVFITLIRILSQKGRASTFHLVLRIFLLFIPILAYAYTWAAWKEDVVQFYQKIAFTFLFMLEQKCSQEHLISFEQPLFSSEEGQQVSDTG
jgi:hypothetical membrane protein